MSYSLVLKTRRKKRSDVRMEEKRIRKEISPRTKASPAKDIFSEKMNEIERLHQPIPQLSVSQTGQNDDFSLVIYILYILLLHHFVLINNC